MTTSKNMRTLFNEIFPQLMGKEKIPSAVETCFIELMKSNPNDIILKSIKQYFYPSVTSQEKNPNNKFWFQKYENDNIYNESSFALDILIILKNYVKNKDAKKASRQIEKLIEKFNSYKNANYFILLTTKEKINILSNLSAYLQKDLKYFKDTFNVDINISDDITDSELLEDLFLGNTITEREIDLYKNIDKIEKNYNKLNEDYNKLQEQITEMNEKLEKIYLRDTIKYSIKYLYRLFYKKYFTDHEFKSNVYDEICSLKGLLKNPRFIDYSYLLEFLESVEFGDLIKLNKTAHPNMKERNFDLIKSYVDNKKPYLNKVVNFLKGLPGINDYINLEIDFYFNKDLLEEKINESFNFETLYEQAIGI